MWISDERWEQLMAAIDDLNTAVATLTSEVGALGGIVADAVTQLGAGVPATNDPAIAAAATAVGDATAALVSAGKQLQAALPAPPPAPGP